MYGTFERVLASYPAERWDPTTVGPSEEQVLGWLEMWSGVVNGRVGHLVQVPVDRDVSPLLWNLLAGVVELYARAEVYDRLQSPVETGASQPRLCDEWRRLAERALEGVLQGNLADGMPLHGLPGERPLGDESGAPAFTMDQRF